MNRLFGLGLLWLSAVGCGSNDASCDADNPCDFGEMCVLGECVTAECVTSEQCPMETYCADRACTDGCENDDDCFAGDQCNTEDGVCEPAACDETAVDCDFREFCNTATGECYDAGNRYCMPCENDSDCGGDNICYGNYCAVDCSDGQECPSGFECYPFSDGVGNTVGYWCYTYCGYYEDWDGSETPPVPPESAADCLQEPPPPKTETEP